MCPEVVVADEEVDAPAVAELEVERLA